jgi:hypothetical protein
MFYRIIKPNIDLDLLEHDIILNSEHVKPEFNKYSLWVESHEFSKIVEVVLDNLKEETKENFDVYVKNIFTYIQEESQQKIEFTKQLKNGINPISKYSFIFFTKSFDSKVLLKLNNKIIEVILHDGDLLIFKTENFSSDESQTYKRIGIYGSLTNEITPIKTNKNLI